jgi:hypothetical protein
MQEKILLKIIFNAMSNKLSKAIISNIEQSIFVQKMLAFLKNMYYIKMYSQGSMEKIALYKTIIL